MKDISLHLMDIVQNSISAGADKIILRIWVEPKQDTYQENSAKISYNLCCEIIDNGRGMEPEFAKKAADPFKTTRKTRNIGMGLPLLKLSAEMAGGELILESELNKGTRIKAFFDVDSIDRIPLGDVASTVKMLVMANPDITWNIWFSSSGEEFELDTDEIKKELEDIPLNNNAVLDWIEKTVNDGIRKVFGGVLDEVR
ncbi:MAG: sensor histidine kinase [Clostridiaceae bacterium]|nr:sensor histidine kinase [Clostridiaceae bacterium]